MRIRDRQKTARPDARPGNRRSRRGMTLIEVILAMGIFVTVILWTMATLFNAITANRILAANIAANAIILQKREEIQEIAKAAGDSESPAVAVIRHYAGLAAIGGTSGDDGVLVGPANAAGAATPVAKVRWDADNRGLVHTFPIAGPAESVSAAAPFNRGYGEMVIYLNEPLVPVDTVVNGFWDDLGDNGSAAQGDAGYDINGDRSIANKLLDGAKNDLARGDFAAFATAIDPRRLPIDITVRYFADAAHSRNYLDTSRRTVIADLRKPGADGSFQ